MQDPKSLESKIVQIEGPGGEFGVAFAGTSKESLCYFYQDSKRKHINFDANSDEAGNCLGMATSGHVRKRVMTFEPKIEGVKREDLFEYEDECGNYYISWVGGMPEREHAFYYGDDKYEFCFYADRKWDGNKFDVDIKNATIYRFHGPRPRINAEDFDRIGRNMAKFFSERWFLVPNKPIPPTEKFRSLTLSWLLP
jgi:hypothetical protein